MAENDERKQPSRADGAGLAEDAPDGLADAAAGRKISAEGERSALDYLLGKTFRPYYDARVDYETEEGMRPLTFRLLTQDDRKLDEIDARNRKGEGPFAKLDKTSRDSELVFTATETITDEAGKAVKPGSAEFRGEHPSGPGAMELRFKYQPGLLSGLAEEIRRISGYSPDRVGQAKRVLIDAVGGS